MVNFCSFYIILGARDTKGTANVAPTAKRTGAHMATRGLLREFWERGKALAQFACAVHLFHEHVLEITLVRWLEEPKKPNGTRGRKEPC